ncbi:MAG: hypothetical protein ACR2HS_01470 [Gammaproteobacteria bacterium]
MRIADNLNGKINSADLKIKIERLYVKEINSNKVKALKIDFIENIMKLDKEINNALYPT